MRCRRHELPESTTGRHDDITLAVGALSEFTWRSSKSRADYGRGDSAEYRFLANDTDTSLLSLNLAIRAKRVSPKRQRELLEEALVGCVDYVGAIATEVCARVLGSRGVDPDTVDFTSPIERVGKNLGLI